MRLAKFQFEIKLQKCIRIGITIFISSDVRSEIALYGSARASP